MVIVKGITQRLRDLVDGECIDVTDIQRDNLYLIARRLGIKIQVNKTENGFDVTKVSGEQSRVVVEPVTVIEDFDFGA